MPTSDDDCWITDPWNVMRFPSIDAHPLPTSCLLAWAHPESDTDRSIDDFLLEGSMLAGRHNKVNIAKCKQAIY